MRRVASLLLALLLAATALAGCTEPGADDETPTPTPTAEATPTPIIATPTSTETPTPTPTPPTTAPVLDSSTYALETTGMPGQALPGARFNFTLYANGSVTHASDHIGAHYADNDTTSPPVTPGRKDCEHVAGDLPGTFEVLCTIMDEGTWHVWGHARINDSGELRNWWSEPFVVKVRNYSLNASGFPTNPPTSKQNFTFTLTVNGTDNATTEHLGAHYWNATQSAPTVANSMGACQHAPAATGALGTHTITCSIENTGLAPKDFFLRGHVRITEGGTTLDWWSDEVKVSIVGVPASPI